MFTFKPIFVARNGDGFKVLHASERFEIDANADNILERVRQYYHEQWSAKLHALRWIYPEDLLIDTQEGWPSLVLYVDESGQLPLNDPGDSNIPGSAPDRVLVEATRRCSYQPWSDSDWLDRMSNWFKSSFAFDDVQEISQIRVTTNGAVLKVRGERETYFLKALPTFFSYEPKLLSVLSSKLPTACPAIVPCSPVPNSHITFEIKGRPLRMFDDTESWKSILKQLARVQLESVSCLDELRLTGIPCQNLGSFASNLENIVEELIAVQVGAPNELNPAELRTIPKLVAGAIRDCELMAQCGLPDTIIHGDCNDHNVLWTSAGDLKLIDWSFARIGHPFFMMNFTLLESYDIDHRMHALRAELTHAYLERWLSFSSLNRLWSALEAAHRLRWIEAAQYVSDYIRLLRKDEPGSIACIASFLRHALSSACLAG